MFTGDSTGSVTGRAPTGFNSPVTRSALGVAIRLAGFALVVSAEVYLIVRIGDGFRPWNHFGYFTILSNLFAAVVLLIGAIRPIPDSLRGAAVLYMATTGIVYAVLLRGVDVDTPAYANWILHVVMPVLVVADWVLVPPGRPIALPAAAWWLALPVGYLGYTLVRGSRVDWYPYPFLDPRINGYAQVAVTCVGVAVTILALAVVVIWTGNRLAAGRAATAV